MRCDAQYSRVRRDHLETLFAADFSKEQKKRAAERAGASLRAGRPSHRATVRSHSAIRTTLTRIREHHPLHAKVLRTVILVDHRLMHREHANPLQFLVGEI